MLYNKDFRIGADHIVFQVHIPRTSGTSQRTLFEQWFGHAACLMNYEGELASLSLEEREPYRLVSGHVGYGSHVLWNKTPVYITAVRHPVERFLSVYAAFLTNPNNRGHRFVGDLDVNQFLRVALESTDPFLSHQFHNTQCRLVCGVPSFDVARRYIDTHYFLAAPFPETGSMMRLLATALGVDPVTLPAANEMRGKMARHHERATLTPESIALLLEHEQQDALLYSHVQKAFAAVQASSSCATPLPAAPAQALFPPGCVPDKLWLRERLEGIAAELAPTDMLSAQLRIIPADFPLAQASHPQLTPLAGPLWQVRLPDGSADIACEEAHLLDLAFQAGLQIHGQRKGYWLTTDNALDPVDSLLLRKRRFGTIAEVTTPAAHVVAACNICGGTMFGPGPHGRMAVNGRAPRCLTCGSLERQRITYRLLQALPGAMTAGTTALQIGKEIMRPGLFLRLDTVAEEGEQLLHSLQQRPDGHYDFIILSTQLEQVPDDRAALANLRRMLARQGMLLVCFGDYASRGQTLNHGAALAPWGSWHSYGRDVASHFAFEPDSGLVLGVDEADPSTGQRLTIHAMFHARAQCSQFAQFLRAYSTSAVITP